MDWRGRLLVATALLGVVVAGAAGQTPRYRAVWADAFHGGFKSTSQIFDLVSRAQAGNYNVIIAEVLAYQDTTGGGHGAYWNSAIVPKALDISGGIDPLALLVAQAHAANPPIQVHAWIVPYRASRYWPPSGNSLLAAHPEWLMVERADMGNGPNKIAGNYYLLDPGSPDVQAYLVSIVQELITNYDIDGINLDYIRYIQTDAGYPSDENYEKSSLARFRELTWYSGTPAPTGEPSWDDFRRRTISEFVRRLRAELPLATSNPQQPLRLTADLICFGNAPSSFINSSAYGLFQNWKLWMELGWLDAGIPMNYKREYDASQAAWYRNWVNAAIGWRYDRHMVCGQGNYLNRKVDSITQLQYALNAGADGTCNYAYYTTADENMNGSPESDWSWYPYVAANLFTTSVDLPDMPWRDPATAVEGTLYGRITHADTGEPIDGASVQLTGLSAVETDGNGYYLVTMVPAAPGGSTYDMTINKFDCNTYTVQDVTVLPGTVVQQDVQMCGQGFLPGDMDLNGRVDIDDLPVFLFCYQGPGYTYNTGHLCLHGDANDDDMIDTADLASFQVLFGTQQ
jgi:uncharacterized lipoprotein YddW (UPF0748 family)